MPGAVGLGEIVADLATEHAELDATVAHLDPAGWDTPTPAEGWTVRDQISHLAFFDEAAFFALTDPSAFEAQKAGILAGMRGAGASVDVSWGRELAARELFGQWQVRFGTLVAALGQADPKARIPWYGPAMGAVSFTTARLMETWAHGQDIVDALGVTRRPSARLRHIAHIGIGARPWSYQVHGLPIPDAPVYVRLRAPDGGSWEWGAADAPDRVRASALDFALVVTQRRHLDDTMLEVEGPHAAAWMRIAQAFAGPPGPGRSPGQFVS